jgi:hypothetical protein
MSEDKKSLSIDNTDSLDTKKSEVENYVLAKIQKSRHPSHDPSKELHFKVQFLIFDQYKKITQEQRKLRQKLIDEDLMKIIIPNVVKLLPQYKCLDRLEPNISSLDENYQLRLDMEEILSESTTTEYMLRFNQSQCKTGYFKYEDLKNLTLTIQKLLSIYIYGKLNAIISKLVYELEFE